MPVIREYASQEERLKRLKVSIEQLALWTGKAPRAATREYVEASITSGVGCISDVCSEE
jgi:hypothetical protein